MAATTGNPKFREKFEVDEDVNRLERKRKAWQSGRANRMMAKGDLEKEIDIAKSRLEAEDKIVAALPDSKYKTVTVRGAVTELQEGDTTWLYSREAGEAILSRMPMLEAALVRNGDLYLPLDMNIGGIELVVAVNGNTGMIRGMIDGKMLPANIVSPSKSPAMLGNGVRNWWNTSDRRFTLEDAITRSQRQLEILGPISMAEEWPLEQELNSLRERQRDLNKWFMSQEFTVDVGNDPFEAMLATLKSNAPTKDDVLELAPNLEPFAGADLFELLEDEEVNVSFNDTKQCDKVAAMSLK